MVTRKTCDFYPTPIEVVDNFLTNFPLEQRGNKVLEPSAGCGNVCKSVKRYYPNKSITAVEIRAIEEDTLNRCADHVIIGDFLQSDISSKYDIIVGNPPYSKAIDFIKKSLGLLEENGVLIFLLRTAFLESRSRYDFWQENPLSGLYTLSKRPSFTGKGTDATSYSWFVWDKKTKNQCIKII